MSILASILWAYVIVGGVVAAHVTAALRPLSDFQIAFMAKEAGLPPECGHRTFLVAFIAVTWPGYLYFNLRGK